MILDVGCGDEPKGDVNVDLFTETLQANIQNKDVTKTKVDIVADGNYLPFKDNSFEKVVSYHVIEHSKTPFKFLKELVRVSKNEVELKCPHRLSWAAKAPYHVSFFNKTWFNKACELLNPKVKKYSVMATLETAVKIGYFALPFVRPHEIVLTIKKY